MENLANQLQSVKLKRVDGPVRDFSNPKTAGFLNQEEIDRYQSSVLDVNSEEWLDLLSDFTFPSKLLAVSRDEADLFVDVYKRLFANLDPDAISRVKWENHLTTSESELVSNMITKLQGVIDSFRSHENDSVFVKLSSRSPKDAPMAQERFKSMYKSFLMKEDESLRSLENIQITCILKAGFEALRISTAIEIVDMCFRSERVYQDFLLALSVPDRFRENWVIRKFVDIDVDMEFRGFVHNRRLTAVSQYNYLIFSQRLVDDQSQYCRLIETFFKEDISPKMVEFVPSYIIDFAVCNDGQKIWAIEINPFLVTTDAALFSWEHELSILDGSHSSKEVVFRVTEKPRPGAKAMLPRGVKDMIAQS